MKTFFLDGIPPLGQRSGSGSRGTNSVSKEKHEDAELFERTSFGLLPDKVLCHRDSSFLWMALARKGGKNNWGSESDIQGMVKQVLEEVIYTIGLEEKIQCFNELSIFDLCPDIWIVCEGGIPIGVVEVKKPGRDNALQNPYVQGQIFDYMLRLQSFFGIKHVFGILSSYEQWRVCWMPTSTERAARTTTTDQAADEDETETETVVPERVLHGS
jgi:hypothetical protein